jgi:hypothetical protein
MEFLLLFLLGGIGLTSIIVDSEFFAGPKTWFAEKITKRAEELGDEAAKTDRKLYWMRKLNYLLNCYQCMGFWVGFFLAMFMSPLAGYTGLWHLLEWVICGGAISFTTQIGMALFNYLNVEYGPKQ